MNLTDYHAKYFAHELTRRCPSDSVEKLAAALADAQVDLNPHQVDAALFAFRSPLSKGALLADEVGPRQDHRGRAGAVAEVGRAEAADSRHHAVQPAQAVVSGADREVLPALPHPGGEVLQRGHQAGAVPAVRGAGHRHLLLPVRRKARRATCTPSRGTSWSSTKRTGCATSTSRPTSSPTRSSMALAGKDKLLLTATPLQNSLLELFGLVSFIDEHTFGDLKSFREQFANLSQEQVFETLKARLKPICHRTLRRQVLPYVPYTKRLPLVRGVHAGGERGPALPPGLRVPAARQPAGAAGQPALPDDAGAAQAARLVHLRHRRRAHLDVRPAEGEAQASRSQANRWKRSSTRTTRRWTKLPRNGHEDEPAAAAFRGRPRGHRAARSPTSTASRPSPPPSSTTPRARRLLKALQDRIRQGSEARAARRRPSSSPSRGAPRTTCCACWPTARSPKASSCSTAPTRRPLQADLRAWLERHAGHRPRHRLAHRRHALRAGGLLPRDRAAS